MSKASPIAATFSKDPTFWGKDFQPCALNGALKGKVRGTDGKWYTDWVSGLGANLLGHNFPGFIGALERAMESGIAHSLPHVIEEMAASMLAEYARAYTPGWGNEEIQVRFGATGSDACNAAVVLARAVTGRTQVARLSGGYHGNHLNIDPPAWGTLPVAPYFTVKENIERLLAEKQPEGWAAVIVEHGVIDPPTGAYERLRAFCSQYGILLIMDEVVTGFRFGPGGACARYKIQPDILCLGKALGNGLPVSAMVAPKQYMDWFARDDPVFVLSNTTNGNTLSMAAAVFVLENWDEQKCNQLWDLGQRAKRVIEAAGWRTLGQPVRFIIDFASDYERAYFITVMRDLSHLCNRPFFVNLGHNANAIEALGHAAAEVRRDLEPGGKYADPRVLAKAMKDQLPRKLFPKR